MKWNARMNELTLYLTADVEAAAELGRTLLERNRELETTIRQLQAVLEDQSQEMQVIAPHTPQSAAKLSIHSAGAAEFYANFSIKFDNNSPNCQIFTKFALKIAFNVFYTSTNFQFDNSIRTDDISNHAFMQIKSHKKSIQFTLSSDFHQICSKNSLKHPL
jgi:hypothetical protein